LNLVLNARKSVDELRVMAGVWHEDCGHMLPDRFRQAVSECRKTSQWFPTTAQINKQYSHIVASITEPLQIDSGPSISPEEERKRMVKIRGMLADSPVMYINEKYKPANPKGKNVVYVSEPFAENKRKLKLMR
jgi:hypothetical protein